MTIDATIVGISQHADGTVTVAMESRLAPASGGVPASGVMTILNPPDDFNQMGLLQDVDAHGDSFNMYLGNSKFADRKGYTELLLIHGWDRIASQYRERHMGAGT